MTLNPQTVSVLSSYTFELTIIKPIQLGGLLILNFGNIDLTQTTAVGTTTACTTTYGFNSQTAVCTVTSKNELTISNAFPTQDNLLIFTLNAIKNPAYVNEFTIVAQTFDASANKLDTSGPTAIKCTTLPGSLQTTITNLGSTTVGDMTDISLSFTIQDGLDSPSG